MSTRRAPKLAAVKAPPAKSFTFKPRPEWAHPNNAAHQAAYSGAVDYLRQRSARGWIMDSVSLPPKWRALPVGEALAP